MYSFIADVHLGKLARLLRMIGFDTLYSNQLTFKQIIRLAIQENRILLTRSSHIKPQSLLQFFIVTDEESFKQSEQVIHHFNLLQEMHPFTRCTICNGILERISKENIFDKLPPKTILYFDDFWQCNNCHRIYWKGSHYEHMQQILAKYGL